MYMSPAPQMSYLLDHFPAVRGHSRALITLQEKWRELCEAADHDRSGTLELREIVAIWDKVSSAWARVCGAPPLPNVGKGQGMVGGEGAQHRSRLRHIARPAARCSHV